MESVWTNNLTGAIGRLRSCWWNEHSPVEWMPHWEGDEVLLGAEVWHLVKMIGFGVQKPSVPILALPLGSLEHQFGLSWFQFCLWWNGDNNDLTEWMWVWTEVAETQQIARDLAYNRKEKVKMLAAQSGLTLVWRTCLTHWLKPARPTEFSKQE